MVDDRDRTWVEAMSEAYERWLVPTLFVPFADDLVERVVTHAPRRVLELAAGTGVVTRRLVEQLDAEVVATDLNPGMIAVGERYAPGATWRQADALSLPFEDASSDVVVCQFGVMFFPDKRAAFAEVHRVLAPGGAFLFSTWGTVEESTFAAALAGALETMFPGDPPTFSADVPHGYHDERTVMGDLRAAGFAHGQFMTVTLQGHAASAADVAAGFCHGTPLRAVLMERGDLDELAARVATLMEATLGVGPVAGSLTARVFQADA
jgi:SAM-dependent methyltransferase